MTKRPTPRPWLRSGKVRTSVISQAAVWVRSIVGTNVPVDLTPLTDELGLRMIGHALDEDGYAMVVVDREGGRAGIVTDQRRDATATRWAAAVAICHYILHTGYGFVTVGQGRCGHAVTGQQRAMLTAHREATELAAQVLMPWRAVRAVREGHDWLVTDSALLEAADLFDVPIMVMAERLMEVKS